MKILQLLTTVSFGDAVSNDALAIRRLFSAEGIDTAIYAENVDPRLPKGTARPVEDLPKLKKDDLLIYHLSTGTRLNFEIDGYPCRKVMIWHNITPPAYFAPYSKDAEKLCEYGLQGMIHLKDAFEKVIADSEFNRQNLLDAGYTCPIDVIPIRIPFEDYRQEPDAETLAKYSDGRTNLLFVGRIAPNKKQEDLIRAFDCYRRTWDPEARLILIGSDLGMEAYRERLERYIHLLGAENILFPGHISFRQILAFYRAASAFVCMSEHEGFCVPLTEAMSFDLPIIARDMCAVPYTLGNAGILLDSDDPATAAAAIHRVMTDQTLRESLIAAGRKRLEDFGWERVSGQLRESLKEYIREGKR